MRTDVRVHQGKVFSTWRRMLKDEQFGVLREKSKGVKNGCVERVAQVGSPVVKRAFASCGSLDGEAKEGNHGKAGMLDLGKLKGSLLLRVSSQPEGVKEPSARVQPLFGVKLSIPLELDVSNDQDLNPDQCGHGEWKWLTKVR